MGCTPSKPVDLQLLDALYRLAAPRCCLSTPPQNPLFKHTTEYKHVLYDLVYSYVLSWRDRESRSRRRDEIDARAGVGSVPPKFCFIFNIYCVVRDVLSADSGHHTAESEHSDTESEVRTLKCTARNSAHRHERQ